MRAAQAWWRQMTSRPIFYPNRAVLNQESPLANKIQNTERIYAIWFTGTKSFLEIPEITNVERLLFPHPNSKSLAYYQSTISDGRNLGNEIRQITKHALDKGIEVRWLREFLGYTLMIGNPKGKNPWAQIEIVFPIIHGGANPSFEFQKARHAETVQSMIDMFNNLWASDKFSAEPENQEKINGAR